jgi:hypothetical protein
VPIDTVKAIRDGIGKIPGETRTTPAWTTRPRAVRTIRQTVARRCGADQAKGQRAEETGGRPVTLGITRAAELVAALEKLTAQHADTPSRALPELREVGDIESVEAEVYAARTSADRRVATAEACLADEIQRRRDAEAERDTARIDREQADDTAGQAVTRMEELERELAELRAATETEVRNVRASAASEIQQARTEAERDIRAALMTPTASVRSQDSLPGATCCSFRFLRVMWTVAFSRSGPRVRRVLQGCSARNSL